MSRNIKGYQGMSRRKFRKLEFLRNLKGFLGAFLMRVWLISVFKLVFPNNFLFKLIDKLQEM